MLHTRPSSRKENILGDLAIIVIQDKIYFIYSTDKLEVITPQLHTDRPDTPARDHK